MAGEVNEIYINPYVPNIEQYRDVRDYERGFTTNCRRRVK